MNSRRVESFLLRLVVRDDQRIAAEEWRGRIQHVGSGCERHFDQLQDMIAFITAQIDASSSMVITFDEQLGAE